MAENILITFAPKGDEDVLDAVRKVTKHVGDLKKIAKTPIDLEIVKGSMPIEDYKRLVDTVNRAKEATRDFGKEAAIAGKKAAREAAIAAKEADKMAASFAKAAGGVGGGGGRRGGLFNTPDAMAAPDISQFSKSAVDKVNQDLKNFNKNLDDTGKKAKAAGFQLGFVTRIIAAMGVRAAVREVFQLADAYTTLQNKLKTTVAADSLGFVSEKLFEIAQSSRTSLEGVTTAFSRTTRSVKALGKSQAEVLQFTESLSKAIQIGGSTSVEASNAMIQLSQGMGSGALRGDELRSVLEQLPIVAELIADKMGVPISALRKLGSEGKITTEVIFDAINEASDEMNEKMKNMDMTVGQAFTRLRNKATMESKAMQGVMKALANTIEFVTNHFDQFIIAVEMLAAAIGAGGLIKLIMATVEAFQALRVVMLAHPLLAAAGAIFVLVSAFTPLIAQMKVMEGSTITFGDVWSSVWDEVKATFFGEEISDGIKTVDGSIVGLTESTKDWILTLAQAADILIRLTPGQLFKEGGKVEAFAKRAINRIDQDADFRETQRMLEEAKKIMAEDMSLDEGPNTQGPPKPPKVKDPKGQTFDQLMEDLNRAREKAAITSDLSADTIESRVAKEWLDAVDKLEDKIANGLTPAQSALIEKAIEEKIILEDMLKLREQIQKSIKEEEKAQIDAFVKEYEAWFKFKEEQDKIAGKEAKADRQVALVGNMEGIAASISPNFGIQQKITELEKFQEFAKQNHLADWAKEAAKEIDALKASMRWENTHFETFADQMKSIFGPGGTLVKGFADAAANAIVMSESLGDLRRALVDVLNSVQKQALSALIQLPMNLAIGALTNSITGGGGPSTLGSSGARSVSAAEAKSWNLQSLDSGGYTGNMGTGQVAGIVHGQEFVLNADATRRMGRQNLEMINKGGTPVSGTTPAKIVINNNAGAQVEAREVSPGEIEVMINKAIRERTGNVIAGQINDPNSPVSRSLQKNIDTGRRRM